MRLTRFRVQNYKVIDDTGWVPLDERVTALVGKNESGKTAVMQAIWKTKNVAGAKFDKLLDYPRERYARERKETQEVVSLDLQLTPEEVEELSAKFPQEPKPKPTSVIVTTLYTGEDHVTPEVRFDDKLQRQCIPTADEARKVINKTQAALKKLAGENDTAIDDATTAALDAINDVATLYDPTTVQAITAFQSSVTQWLNADESRKEPAKKDLEKLAGILQRAKQGDPAASARTWVLQNLPTFIYFSDYGQLETRIHLPAYLSRLGSPDERTRTQKALFTRSKLDAKEILELGRPKQNNEPDEQVQRRKDKRQALLESASFDLTGQWTAWWTEKRHKTHFLADGEDLVLKVSDEHNPASIPFEERSRGFQWFFSFYLVFLVESEQAHKGAILLLDEPGLHLHPTLQAKLIDLFERISDTNQLIYSTHLPFMVDGDHLERVRTVYLTGDEPKKAVVSTDLRPAGDRDTLFPIQAAIGYSIAQTLFLGKRSLIVEGITDYWIMKTLDATANDTTQLHPDTILIPAGGTSRMMPLASIMYGTTGLDGRQMLVLLDSDTTGVQAAKRFQDELFGGDDSRLLLLGQVLNLQHATIEDLVPLDEYAAAVQACGHTFKLTDEDKKAPSNIQAIQSAFARKKLGTFTVQHRASAALHLINKWVNDPETIAQSTSEKAAALFNAINQKFNHIALPRTGDLDHRTEQA